MKSQHKKIIFGLKLRQLRQEAGWNFEELSRNTGISVSYLNEIEKGKKFPQPDNQRKLAQALDVPVEFLTSPELTKQYAPLGDLLESNFLSEIPLDLFGIEVQQVVEIIARAPDKVNAFISALLEIARIYSLREENFYFAALRAYQELRVNYFEEIEDAADAFVREHQLPANGGVPENTLRQLLEAHFDYRIDQGALDKYPELQGLRSVFNPHKKRLLLHSQLNQQQRCFQLAKELGFCILGLKERPLASTLLKINSFEEVLNNYKAAYFAVAVLINRQAFVADINRFFDKKQWDPGFLPALMLKYQASPEVLFQRFNVLTRDFKLEKVFFQRIIHDLDRNGFDIDKELHLHRRHQPHASGLNEHYCRRWLAISLLQQLQQHPEQRYLPGIQRARFLDSGEEYLCIALAKTGFPTVNRNIGVTLGVLLDENAKKRIRFWNDPAIPEITVNVTCERCSLLPCPERAAEPKIIQKREHRRQMQDTLRKLTEK
jgi:XRE family transcriptional regulator, fatty acid utilization regulator